MDGSWISKVLVNQQRALEYLVAEAEGRCGLETTKRSEARAQALQRTRVFRARDLLNAAEEVLRAQAERDEEARKFLERTQAD